MARNAVDKYDAAQEDEKNKIAELEEQVDSLGGILVTSVTTTEHGNIEAEDKYGNPVIVPGGFKAAKDSGKAVEEGIVIEDEQGNQFVWIPVSNLDGDNNETNNTEEDGLITLSDGKKVEITLGRYSFDTTSGEPTLMQIGTEYSKLVTIETYYQEPNDNLIYGTGAKDLAGFVESVKTNHGYYLGRYEASFGSGNKPSSGYPSDGSGKSSIMTDQKPVVKKSISQSISSMNYTEGTLWNYITENDASKVSKNMYEENEYIESDLVNSYAWDTTVVYIQKMGNKDYTIQKDGNGALKNTGETGDVKCNIYDMVGNVGEWTTEHSIYVAKNATSSNDIPFVVRGGYYYNTSQIVVGRYMYDGFIYPNVLSHPYVGFRPIIYVK